MDPNYKGKSPFYPGQPVPVELFVGRINQINRIMDRGVKQVASGKPIAMFIEGEYGIGKSSMAGFVQSIAETEYGLLKVYVSLGAINSVEEVASKILESTIRLAYSNLKISEKIKNILAKYIGEQSFFGFNLHLDKIKQDAPNLSTSHGLLGFFRDILNKLSDEKIKGVFLVLDEINGITSDSKFSHFIKDLIDTNALSQKPFPLLLMLCGVEEKRREMIQKHQPIDRIFDVVEVKPMNKEEMEEFFKKAFESVQIKIEQKALDILTHYSAGFPKIMHLVGDAAFWEDRDGVIDVVDADTAVITAADDVGKKYVDQQIVKALKSKDYRSILSKIAQLGPDQMSFERSKILKGLSENEGKKFDNFLRKMKELNVLRSGDSSGEYVFNIRMVRFYIWLRSLEEENE